MSTRLPIPPRPPAAACTAAVPDALSAVLPSRWPCSTGTSVGVEGAGSLPCWSRAGGKAKSSRQMGHCHEPASVHFTYVMSACERVRSQHEGFPSLPPSLQIFFTLDKPDATFPSLRRSSACPCCCSSTASARDAPCHCCVRVHVRCAHEVGKVSSLCARTKVNSISGNHEQAPRIKDNSFHNP